LEGEPQTGSLAIRHLNDTGITFKYKIFIKRAGGEFVQWGATGHECHPDWNEPFKAFGPDVQFVLNSSAQPVYPLGIFGLTHRALLQSEWIEDDTLTVKVHLEVRRPDEPESSVIKPEVDVPPPTIGANLLALLDTGNCSDVTFIVDGQHIKAHSPILCARSEVFDKQLNCGLSESVSKEIMIMDCDAKTFKALLRFLYTDDFAPIEEIVNERATPSLNSTANEAAHTSRRSVLQSLLAVSHKYQVSRLQSWCEQQLCKSVCVNEVCSILCKAHLYEAKCLEKTCLAFLKENMEQVVKSATFGKLSADWPEVMLKINIFAAGVSEGSASSAIEAHRDSFRKRHAPDCDPKSDEPDAGDAKRSKTGAMVNESDI
jgi:speckle-type POZ protein